MSYVCASCGNEYDALVELDRCHNCLGTPNYRRDELAERCSDKHANTWSDSDWHPENIASEVAYEAFVSGYDAGAADEHKRAEGLAEAARNLIRLPDSTMAYERFCEEVEKWEAGE